MKIRLLIGIAVMSAASLPGCSMMPAHDASATAEIAPTQGNNARGTIHFTQHGDKVLIDATIVGLTPGQHGFHIHEKGDCSAPDATSAGGHFNPNGQPHGDPYGEAHHAGDMPMLNADENGKAKLYFEMKAATLQPGETSLIGKAVVIHQKVDDFSSQPAGNSGARIGCGVIVAS
jgi:Cu-Zn family superoxide dismutase